MSNDSLIAIIMLLVGAHYASLVYRLHKAEEDLVRMQRDFSSAAIAAAVAVANAANAAAAAAAAAASATRK